MTSIKLSICSCVTYSTRVHVKKCQKKKKLGRKWQKKKNCRDIHVQKICPLWSQNMFPCLYQRYNQRWWVLVLCLNLSIVYNSLCVHVCVVCGYSHKRNLCNVTFYIILINDHNSCTGGDLRIHSTMMNINGIYIGLVYEIPI